MELLQNLNTTKRSRNTHITDLLEGVIEDEDGNLLTKIFQGAEVDAEAAQNYRWHARSTQAAQDLALREYRQWISGYLKDKNPAIVVPDKNSEEEFDPSINDQYLFPNDYNLFCQYVAIYLMIVANNVKSAIRGRDKPSISTLRGRRDQMYFWLLEKLPKEARQQRWKFLIDMTKPIKFAANKYGLSKRRVTNKLFFGKNELQDLIDHDFETTQYVAVAAQHHLAWCITFTAGLRPGSLAKMSGRNDTLIWSDIKITRVRDSGLWKGSIIVQLAVRNLKTNREDDPDVENRDHTLTITSPRLLKNLPLSVPHRILCELLRRGLLADYDTIEELLADGDQLNIRIKPTALDQPVFLAGTPGGRTLSEEPLRSSALSEYLGRRALLSGYPNGATMYAWRRGAGTKVAQQTDADQARRFLAHGPNTKTFELYYDGRNQQLDIFSIAANEDRSKNAARLFDAVESPALHTHYEKVAQHALDRRGIVETWIADQDSVKALVDSGNNRAAKKERARLRELAMRAIYAEAREQARAGATLTELEARKAELNNPSKLFAMIKSRVQEVEANGMSDDQDADEVEALVNEAAAYRDLEDDIRATNQDQQIEVESFDDVDIDDVDPAVWLTYVEHFMQILLQDRDIPPGEPRLCALCVDEDYVDEDHKTKLWASQSLLEKHLSSNFHTPHRIWQRKIEAEQKTAEGKLLCPYGCGRTYGRMVHLEQHIEGSKVGDKNVTAEHENLKIADGWYNTEFKQDRRTEAVIQKRRVYDRQVQGYLPIDKYDYPELRYVDDDPDLAVTIGGGLTYLLKNAVAVSQRARDVENLAQEMGISTGQRPSGAQLSQLAALAQGTSPHTASKPKFETGQGFNPKALADRLKMPPKAIQEHFKRSLEDTDSGSTPLEMAMTNPDEVQLDRLWIPKFDDFEDGGLVSALADLVDSDVPDGDDLEKGQTLYRLVRESYDNAISQGDGELAQMYDVIGSAVRQHVADMGGDVDIEN